MSAGVEEKRLRATRLTAADMGIDSPTPRATASVDALLERGAIIEFPTVSVKRGERWNAC